MVQVCALLIVAVGRLVSAGHLCVLFGEVSVRVFCLRLKGLLGVFFFSSSLLFWAVWLSDVELHGVLCVFRVSTSHQTHQCEPGPVPPRSAPCPSAQSVSASAPPGRSAVTGHPPAPTCTGRPCTCPFLSAGLRAGSASLAGARSWAAGQLGVGFPPAHSAARALRLRPLTHLNVRPRWGAACTAVPLTAFRCCLPLSSADRRPRRSHVRWLPVLFACLSEVPVCDCREPF